MKLFLTKSYDGTEFYSIPHLRSLQLLLLDLLKIVDTIARKNDIDYWIDGGTLLGAVRHRGFIPWDDDIDVCLLKEDFDRLMPLLDDYIRDKEDLCLFYHRKEILYWDEFFASKKISIDHNGEVKFAKIDMFPMKLIEDNPQKIKKDRYLTDVANYFITGNTKYFPKIREKYKFRSLEEALIQKNTFLKYFNQHHIPQNISVKGKTGLLVDYPFGDSYVSKKREYKKYTDIFPLKEIAFEGISFKCPNNPDRYLKNIFGDYMALPPLSKRKPYGHKIILNRNIANLSMDDFIIRENSYFYLAHSISYKVKVLWRQIKSNGFKSGYTEIIKPFLQKVFTKIFSKQRQGD